MPIDLTQLQKDRVVPILKKEIAKIAEGIIKQKTTLQRLKELLEIEIEEEDKNNPEEVERLKRTIRDYEILTQMQTEDLELLESVQTELSK